MDPEITQPEIRDTGDFLDGISPEELAEVTSALSALAAPSEEVTEPTVPDGGKEGETAAASVAEPDKPAEPGPPAFDNQFRSSMKQWQAEQAQAREREDQRYAQRISELQAKVDEWDNLKADPKALLDRAGYTVQELAEQELRGETPESVQFKRLEARLKQERQEREALQAEIARQQAERNINEFKARIGNALSLDNDGYELIHLVHGEQAVDVVYGVIERHWEATQEIIEPAKAAAALESNLLATAQKLLNSSKKLAADGKQPEEKATPATPEKKVGSSVSTLANDVVASPSTTTTFQDEMAEIEALAKDLQLDFSE